METKEKLFEDLNNFWQDQFEEPLSDEAFLTHLNKAEMSEISESSIRSNGDNLIKTLKSLFLFLPGAFLSFLFSYGLFFLYFSFGVGVFEILKGVPWIALSAFMVIFGIGDIKNPKHFAIPLSIFGLAFLTYVVVLLFGDTVPDNIGFHAIYLFPLILTTPLLTKKILENTEKTV